MPHRHLHSVRQFIQANLKRAYLPFFKGHGNLNQLQQLTMKHILDNQNVIVHAPSASGKTEAALAPIAEKIATDLHPGLKLIYIVPTRALANDIFRRVAGPFTEMHLTMNIKTGDHPQFKSGDALITTPESLDSL